MLHRNLILLASLLFVPAAQGQSEPFNAFSLLDYSGAEIFQRFCASCHGEAARGNGPVAANLNTFVPDLTGIAARNDGVFPAARVIETIDGRAIAISSHGTRLMPVWGYEFWREEGADREAENEVRSVMMRLVEYLRSIQIR
jgi:mono/diheme cytochrome c family protein